jgi:hypothetical protein
MLTKPSSSTGRTGRYRSIPAVYWLRFGGRTKDEPKRTRSGGVVIKEKNNGLEEKDNVLKEKGGNQSINFFTSASSQC